MDFPPIFVFIRLAPTALTVQHKALGGVSEWNFIGS